MISIRRAEDRGHADHGWLDTRHTFSFADYHDPRFMGLGPLRVINQDRVAPGRGFGAHGHRDMEIVSYVLEGVLVHEDGMGNGSRIGSGDVQVMSAGAGVTHSEMNGSTEDAVHFLQMWVRPRNVGAPPRYQQKHFPLEERRGRLLLVVSPDGAGGSLTIDQDARLYAGILSPADEVSHTLAPSRCAWVHVARGGVTVNGESLAAGDGAAVSDDTTLVIAGGDGEALVWDLPAA